MRELGMRWWTVPKVDAFKYVKEDIEKLDKWQQDRCSMYAKWLSIYMGHTVADFTVGQPASLSAIYRMAMSRRETDLILNATENCISALKARIASQRPRVEFLADTEGPEGYIIRQKTEGMSKFVQGVWQQKRVYRNAPKCFADGAVFGLGCMKVYGSDGEIVYERVPPAQIIVDELAAEANDPRVIHQVMNVPAEVLLAEYPEHRAAIIDAAEHYAKSFVNDGEVVVTDLVQVIEAWHLSSSSKTKDGKHIVAIDNKTLVLEEYDKPRFPFAFFFWSEALTGWYPQGLVEQQESAQLFVNKMLQRFQKAIHLGAVFRLLFEEGMLKDKTKISNVTGTMVECAPGALAQNRVKFDMPNTMASDAYKFVWQMYDKIFEGTGVSQLSAAGVKPPGIEAAVALRALEEKEAGRHSLTNLAYEDFFLDIAELTIDCAKDLGGKLKAKYRMERSSGVEVINWADVDLERDMFEIQVWPTSLLPYTPSGRLATVEEMMQAGFIDRKQALSLLDAPDLEQFTSLETASLDDVDKQIGLMLVKGQRQWPEVYQDLELVIARATSALIRARHQGVPAARRDMLLDYINKAVEFKMNAEEPPPPPPEAGAEAGAIPGMEGAIPPEGIPPMPPGAGEMPVPPEGPQAPVPMATPEEMMP